MNIYGIDFTSSPSLKKPITCAEGVVKGPTLRIHDVANLTKFSQFESYLAIPGPWVAGLDFPFGQSQRFITNINWPDDWQEYVSLVSNLSRDEFIKLLEDYKEDRVTGDKEHRREIDKLASSISPQKLYGVPVGKMFYEGAKRILASNANIIPVRRNDSSQVIVEAYPAIIARRFVYKRSYKNDQKSKQTPELEKARNDIVNGLFSTLFNKIYGFELDIAGKLKEQIIEDASGDSLDAILCAIQAAWSYMHSDNGYGIPENANSKEGWIADPKFVSDGK